MIRVRGHGVVLYVAALSDIPRHPIIARINKGLAGVHECLLSGPAGPANMLLLGRKPIIRKQV